MKFSPNINLPQKSIFGFKILSSLQSSLSCYLLLIIGRFLNPLFGIRQIQIIASSLFNIVLNISIVILIINLIIKRHQIPKMHFILLNSLLFLYLPIAFYFIFKYIKFLILISFWKKFSPEHWLNFAYNSTFRIKVWNFCKISF